MTLAGIQIFLLPPLTVLLCFLFPHVWESVRGFVVHPMPPSSLYAKWFRAHYAGAFFLLLRDLVLCAKMHPPFSSPRYPVRLTVPSSASNEVETWTKKVVIEFGEDGTCDMKFVLLGKQGFCVKLSVHKELSREKSSFSAEKFFELGEISSCLQLEDREDVEIYLETFVLMYFKEMKQRLMKQHVSCILRILKYCRNMDVVALAGGGHKCKSGE
ncbi:hypothetical protein PIB30_073868 [Stylosanthes scabra]|uniref:Uncharacterized protein n=1 Tax=Stylosanthes scabra TaxID=79078 RepID=A0ABU6SPX5_9FABA|nr:hypothetical protein [Stylosanthes scabra]